MRKAYIIEEDFEQDLALLNNASFAFNRSKWYVNAEIEAQALHIIQILPNGEDREFKVPQYMRRDAHVTDSLEVALLLQMIHNLADYIRINNIAPEHYAGILKSESAIATITMADEGALYIDFADT